MRRLLAMAAVVVLSAPLWGQGQRYQGQLTTSGFPNPTVRVCTEPAVGTPCTPLAAIFSDIGLTQPMANPYTGDSSGNYAFYANCAVSYHIQISGSGISTIDIPNQVLPGCGSGGGGGGGSGNVTALGTLPSGQLLMGQGGQNIAAANLSGDCVTSGGTALTCGSSLGVPFAPSATIDTTNAANVASGILNAARLPIFSGDCSTSQGSTVLSCGSSIARTGSDISTANQVTALHLTTPPVCSNQVLSGLSSLGTPNACVTITSMYVDTSVAITGADLNTTSQVVSTHLASPLGSSQGGTASAFFGVAGPTTAHTYTFPDASATVLTTNAAITAAQGGTGVTGTAHGGGTHVQLSDGTGTSGHCAQFDGSGNVVDFPAACNTAANAAGSNSQVQFNNGGLAFGSSPNLTFSSPALTVGSAGAATGILNLGGATSGVTALTTVTAAGGTWTLRNTTDNVVGAATTDVFTNKTFDSGATGNVFKIAGTTVSGVTGTGSAVLATSPTIATSLTVGGTSNQLIFNGNANAITLSVVNPAGARTYTLPDSGGNNALALTAGAITTGNCAKFDASHNLVDAGGLCGGTGAPGGATTQVQFNSTGSFAGSTALVWVSPTLTIGLSGSSTGNLALAGATSGTTNLTTAVAAGGTWTFRNTTDSVLGAATTDTLTHKTFDSGGTGNVFKIAGTTITALSGNTATLASAAASLQAASAGTLACVDGSGNLTTTSCGTAASPAWNSLGNATANLTVANAAFTSTFNQTTPAAWTWANTTPAISTVSQSSPIFNLCGQYWSGANSPDCFTIQNVVSNTVNAPSTLVYGHTGTTGLASVQLPVLKMPETAAPVAVTSIEFLYADSTLHRLGFVNSGSTADVVVGAATTDTFTNKIFDTASNTFEIAGAQVTGISGNTVTVASASSLITTAAAGTGTCVDGLGNLTTTGCTAPSGAVSTSPAGAQTVTQPSGTDFTLTTSGSGHTTINGTLRVSGQEPWVDVNTPVSEGGVGCDPSGVTDATTCFKNAIAKITNTGGTIYTCGTYNFNLGTQNPGILISSANSPAIQFVSCGTAADNFGTSPVRGGTVFTSTSNVAIPNPTVAPTLATTAGTLSGTFFMKYALVNGFGTTLASPVSSASATSKALQVVSVGYQAGGWAYCAYWSSDGTNYFLQPNANYSAQTGTFAGQPFLVGNPDGQPQLNSFSTAGAAVGPCPGTPPGTNTSSHAGVLLQVGNGGTVVNSAIRVNNIYFWDSSGVLGAGLVLAGCNRCVVSHSAFENFSAVGSSMGGHAPFEAGGVGVAVGGLSGSGGFNELVSNWFFNDTLGRYITAPDTSEYGKNQCTLKSGQVCEDHPGGNLSEFGSHVDASGSGAAAGFVWRGSQMASHIGGTLFAKVEGMANFSGPAVRFNYMQNTTVNLAYCGQNILANAAEACVKMDSASLGNTLIIQNQGTQCPFSDGVTCFNDPSAANEITFTGGRSEDGILVMPNQPATNCANIVLSNWGTGAVCSSVSGYENRHLITVVAGSAPAVTASVIDSFPTAMSVGPQCTAQIVKTSAGAAVIPLSQAAGSSGSTVTFNVNGVAPTASASYTIAVNCSP